MAGNDGGVPEPQEIRIGLSGSHNRESDLDALQQWLERESWYQELLDTSHLKAERRTAEPVPDSRQEAGQGPPMGVGIDDIVLLLLEAALGMVFDQLYRSLSEWAGNRRRLRSEGEDPTVSVTLPDGRRLVVGPPGSQDPAPGPGDLRPEPDQRPED